jgi:hypothetical protein
MKIYLAGGYLIKTAKKLYQLKANRLFSFYDIDTKRVDMDKRFRELRQEREG